MCFIRRTHSMVKDDKETSQPIVWEYLICFLCNKMTIRPDVIKICKIGKWAGGLSVDLCLDII